VPEPSPTKAPDDRLDSWKEIAAYLNRDVTTVQRWEKREGMPVHRHLHDKMGSVYASKVELDAWSRSRHPSSVTAAPPLNDPNTYPKTWNFRSRKIAIAMAAVTCLAAGILLWLDRSEFFWRNPLARARFQVLTDFDGLEQAAAVSRDGRLVAFLSDRSGTMDVWLTQVDSGEFHNLTHGSAPELVNPSVRSLVFSPDASSVIYWTRAKGGGITLWAVPTLGGEPKPFLEGVAECDWSPDGSRLVYHTPGPGDPLYVSDSGRGSREHQIFAAPAGLHSHFPLWSPDGKFIYFVEGSLPDKLDIFRIANNGGTAQRITNHNSRVTHPVFIDKRTLLYLATDADGSGPWLYGIDVEKRIPHRLTSGPERYTSLAASADGRRLVLTLASPKRTLWRLPLKASSQKPEPVSLTTTAGFSPRFGSDYLLYLSSSGMRDGIWKIERGQTSELWSSNGARIIGGPSVSPDGKYLAFSVRQQGHALLYTAQNDGTHLHAVADSLDLAGAPSWSPDGKSITTAANDHRGVRHLYSVPLDGGNPVLLLTDYSTDPAWSPDGKFLLYSGPDIGTRFSVKAINADASPHPLPVLDLTRGARHLAFMPDGTEIVVLRGEIRHKNLWAINLGSGSERQLTDFPADFDVEDFDLSADGNEVVLERVQEQSDIVLIDRSPK
jgi:Tol biopolymer transport system component